MNNKTVLAVALGAAVMGGVAYAAYNSINFSQTAGQPVTEVVMPMSVGSDNVGTEFIAPAVTPQPTATELTSAAVQPTNFVATAAPVAAPDPKPLPKRAEILDVDPITKSVAQNTPRQVCNDVAVQRRAAERDGNVGGTVAGALIGGLVGNQVGGGNGRKAATAAGAVAGGFIGNRVDRNHVGGRVYTTTERQCHTVTDKSSTTKTVGYLVSYRTPDGQRGTLRTGSRPKGSTLPIRNGVVVAK